MKLNDITKHLITYLSDHDITTVNYFDRVTMYLDANTREEYLTNIMDANSNNKLTMKEMTHNSHLDRYLELFQPKDIQFEELKAISGNCAINYVEFAIDFMTYDAQTLENLEYFFKLHVVHPTIKGKTRIFYHYNFKGSNGLNETNYSSSEEDDHRMVDYIDDEARNDPDQKCQHVEYRIRGLNSVKNQGIILKTAVEHLPANKNQHKLDKKKLSYRAFISRNLSNLAVLRRLPSDIFSLLRLKFDTNTATGSTEAQLLSTRRKMHIPAYKPPSHRTPSHGCW